MLHQILIGLIFGLGAAIPIGPMNLEIIRRNLRFGTPSGLLFGLGVCLADLTYIILLSSGAIIILTYHTILKVVSIIGSLILAWFGYSALRMKVSTQAESEKVVYKPLWQQTFQGYLMTLFSPFTILFWTSVSAQIAAISHQGKSTAINVGIGVLIGVIGWMCGLNLVLHHTRHRLSQRTMQWLNYIGGIILIGFAILGVWRALLS